MRHIVVMVATSYPRFPGDGIGSFMEPIAKGVAARGHEVHVVAPWHPAITRGRVEDGVFFHFFHYAPVASLNVFGYASALRADTRLRAAAIAMTPLALAAGTFKAWRVAAKRAATIMHGHWVVPGGAIAARAGGRLPLIVSVHGSDVYLAERSSLVGRVAHRTFEHARHITACSDDLRRRSIALGANPARTETVPYGVDSARFAPSADTRAQVRHALGLGDAPMVFSAGRLVSKKGFEFLVDAAARLVTHMPGLRVLIAGEGDLRDALAARTTSTGAPVTWLGAQPQGEIARLAAAADVIAVPSIRDDAGNVDGLPNFALEAMASATPVVATTAGGLAHAIADDVTGRLIPERNVEALASAISRLLADPGHGRRLGAAARAHVERDFSWVQVAARFEAIYDEAHRVSVDEQR